MLKLYENIKYYRTVNEWSQEELAKRMGYTDRSTIAKIEKGCVDLPESKIMAFAKVFGIKPSDLMGWNETPAALGQPVFTKEDLTIAAAYHEADSVDREMVRRILKVNEKKDIKEDSAC